MEFKVSIIMPTYNQAEYISDSIKSVLCQTYSNFELIIINDGSTDDTFKVIADFMSQDIRIKYFSQENAGQGKARNFGINESTGDLIAFLDSDDVWDPRKLEKQILIFKEYNNVGLVYCKAECLGVNMEKIVQPISRKTFTGNVTKYLLKENFINNSSVILRKYILNQGYSFNEKHDFRNIEDYELWLRISTSNFFYYLNESLVKYRYNQKINNNRERSISYRKMAFLYCNLLQKKGFKRYYLIILYKTSFYFCLFICLYLSSVGFNKKLS